jgi:hypothetical protein
LALVQEQTIPTERPLFIKIIITVLTVALCRPIIPSPFYQFKCPLLCTGCGKLTSFLDKIAVGKISLYGKRTLLVAPPHDGY